jgi:hypothetical protein
LLDGVVNEQKLSGGDEGVKMQMNFTQVILENTADGRGR